MDQRIQGIFNRLSLIQDGQDIVDFLNNNPIEVVFDKGHPAFAKSLLTIKGIKDDRFVYGDCQISCNSKLPDDNLVQSIIHEAQHMKQHFNELGNPSFWPSNEDHCLMRRMQEADAQAATTKITYMMKEAGDPGPYNEVLKTLYAPMCHAFEMACLNDPNALHNGVAKRAAFDAWFNNDYNKQHYDRDTVTHHIPFLMKQLYAYPQHQIRPASLTEDWLKKLGGLSRLNYLDLHGYPQLTSSTYRKDIPKNLALCPPAPIPGSNPSP